MDWTRFDGNERAARSILDEVSSFAIIVGKEFQVIAVWLA